MFFLGIYGWGINFQLLILGKGDQFSTAVDTGIDRGYFNDDHTLIRHVYDLSIINKIGIIDDTFYDLIPNLISDDADQFKSQHVEYFSNAKNEIKKSLQLLETKSLWHERYNNFITTMVYGKEKISSKDAITQLLIFSEKILKRI